MMMMMMNKETDPNNEELNSLILYFVQEVVQSFLS
jgi:hypothetical protein